MSLAPEPYVPRRIAPLEIWRGAGHAIKVYGIHRDIDAGSVVLADEALASVRAAMVEVLTEGGSQGASCASACYRRRWNGPKFSRPSMRLPLPAGGY